MKFKDIWVWIFIFGLISLVAVYLYQQSKTNLQQLELQSVKAINLAKQSLLENYYSYNVQLEGFLARNFFSLMDDDPTSPASRMVEIIDKERKFDISKIQSISISGAPSAHMSPLTVDISRKDTINYFVVQGQLFDFSNYLSKDFYWESVEGLIDQLPGSIAWEFVGTDLDEPPSGLFQIDHIVPINELMKHNFQTHFFDKLYVLNDSGTVLWPGDSEGIQLITPDEATPEVTEKDVTLTNKGQGKVKLLIATIPYEGFVSPFMLGDRSFFLVGVKDSQKFQQVAFRIDFTVLSVFLLGLALVFISIPVISIFNMSEGDVLTKGRMFGVGISLIVLTLVVGFSLAFLQNQQASPNYEKIVGEIEQTFTRQIDAIQAKLQVVEEKIDSVRLDTVFLPLPPGINEFIRFKLDGEISNLIFPTPNGLREIDFQTNPFISIASRDYVREIKHSSDKSFISAHYSKSSGKPEGVISQRMTEVSGKAITFSLTEGEEKLGSQNRYFIFKSNGQVLLKSEKVNTPVTNLQNVIGENKWGELKKLVENNDRPGQDQVWELPIYVNGFEYLATLKRLPLENYTSSVWLLFLLDEHLQDTLYILTTFEALAVLLPYFLILGILGILNVLANPLNTYLSIKKFSFSWYSPSRAKRNQFLLSNYILALLILLFLIIYWIIPLNIFSAFLWAVIFTCQGGLCNFILIHPPGVGRFGSKEFNFLAPAFFMWLVVVAGLLYLSYHSLSFEFFLVNSGIVLVLFAMLLGSFYVMYYNKLPRLNPNFSNEVTKMSPIKSIHYKLTKLWNFITQIQVEKRIFSLNFLLWLMLIGLLPGYIIHRQVFFQEQYLWDKEAPEISQSNERQGRYGFYRDLVLSHERLRRLNFSRIATSEEESVYNFISPKIEDVIASFNLEKSWEIKNTDKSPDSIIGVLFWKLGDKPLFFTFIVLLLLLSFNLLLRLSKRVFLTDYLFSYFGEKLPSACLDRRHNFIISMDSPKALDWIGFHFNFNAENRVVINCSSCRPVIQKIPLGIDAIVIADIHNLITNDNFLDIMYEFREVYFKSGSSVFITSGISFSDMLTSVESTQQRLLLAELMQSFIFYFVPLNFNNKATSIPFVGNSIQDLHPEDVEKNGSMIQSRLFNDSKTFLLNQEISYGANSEALACLLTDEIAVDDWDNSMTEERYERSILSVQRYNKAYFITIWQKLNLREKKMIFYFASEGFINFTNRETMTALLQKGVLILNYQRDYITLFSKSFRNYVLLNTSPEEMDAFRKDERKKGNTKLIQAASISFVFISVAIISFYDPNILDTTSAYISAAIGLAGTIYSFFYKGFRSFWKNEE